MPGRSRENQERLPDFYLSPAVKGRPIEPEIRSAFEQLWPWFWDFVGKQLGDADRAAELADRIAYRVSKYLESRPGQVRSVVGLCRVAAVNLVATMKTREGRIDYCGLGQDIESTLHPIAPDWQDEIELSIWVDQVFRGQDTETRRMLQRRLLDETWDQIGESLNLAGGQARLRFHRSLERIHADVIFRGAYRGRP